MGKPKNMGGMKRVRNESEVAPNPEIDELIEIAVEFVGDMAARQMVYDQVDVEKTAILLVHKNADPAFRAQCKADGATETHEGALIRSICGRTLTMGGIKVHNGGLRCVCVGANNRRRTIEINVHQLAAGAAN